ncbi:MAG: hypothetical protein VB853_05020, partial [Pirellulales bacterium]
FSGGSGRLSIGRDGAFTIWLQYALNAQGQVRYGSSTGQVVVDDGNVVFRYDDETWKDDDSELAAGQKRLTLREKGNEDKWNLVFLKQ